MKREKLVLLDWELRHDLKLRLAPAWAHAAKGPLVAGDRSTQKVIGAVGEESEVPGKVETGQMLTVPAHAACRSYVACMCMYVWVG